MNSNLISIPNCKFYFRILLTIFGQPQKQETTETGETLIWNFEGDIGGESLATGGSAFAKDSFVYKVIAFIENDKLIAQILEDFRP